MRSKNYDFQSALAVMVSLCSTPTGIRFHNVMEITVRPCPTLYASYKNTEYHKHPKHHQQKRQHSTPFSSQTLLYNTLLQHFSATLFSNILLQHSSTTLLYTLPQHFSQNHHHKNTATKTCSMHSRTRYQRKHHGNVLHFPLKARTQHQHKHYAWNAFPGSSATTTPAETVRQTYISPFIPART